MASAKTKTADKGATAGEDQSMEEILQSIRKIIAEENDDPVVENPVEDAAADEDVFDEVQDSDVLELTDAIQDDGSVVNVHDEPEANDILADIDDALKEDEAVSPAPAAPRESFDTGEGLVSDVSIAASAEAMRALKGSADFGSLPFASGETVEGLVQQLLRPMLKEWLDANLPVIVQREVQREVQRISASMRESGE